MLKTLKRNIALVAVSVLGASGLAVVAAPAANAGTPNATAISASAVARVGGKIEVRVTQTAPVPGGSSDGQIVAYAPISVPTGATVAARTATMSGGTGIVNFTPGSGDTITAGSYTLLVWVDDSSGSTTAPDPGSVAVRVTFTAGGNPTSLVTTAASVTGAKEADNNDASVSISATLTDAAGVATLANSNETVSLAAMTTGVSTDSATAVTTGATSLAKLVTHRGLGVYSARIGNDAAGTTTVAMAGSGLLTGSVPAITFTLSTFTVVTMSGASDSATVTFPATQKGLTTANGSHTAPTATTYDAAGPTNLYASTNSAKTITFNVNNETSSAGGTVLSVIAARTGVTLPTGVTAGTSRVTLNSTGDATVVVAASAPANGEGYRITIGGIQIDVTYQTPVPVLLKLGPNTALTSVLGGTTSITGTTTDQFNEGYAGALVTFSIKGNGNRNGVDNRVVGSGTTNADGESTISLRDTSTATLTAAGSDVIDAQAQFVGGASPVNSSGGDITITYVASLAVETVTVTPRTSGGNSNLDTATNGTVAAPYLALGSQQDWTVSVASATGAPISGIPVAVTVTNGVLNNTTQAKTLTYYTTGGSVTVTLIPTTTGKVTVTAVAGGKTGTSDIVTIGNAATDARTLALDAAAYAVAGGELKRVRATVADRFGNGVRGVEVTFSTTAGRFAGGALTVTGTTGADGVAVADLSPMANDPAASGTLTASFGTAIGDASTSTVRADGLAYPARARSATATVTTTAASSASASNPAIDAVKSDVKAVSDTVATLSKAVTTIQSSVTELTSSFSAQIKSLSSAIAKISRAISALSKRIR